MMKNTLETSCIEWTGNLDGSGYGRAKGASGKWMKAHRRALEDSGVKLLPSDVVRHLCDNRRCVNTLHLVVGTSSQNNVDTAQRAARHATLKLTPEQVYEIRKELDGGPRGTAARLARKYKVGKSTISRIQHDKCWWHLPEELTCH